MAVPYILANLAGGVQPLSLIDANFSYLIASPAFTGNPTIAGTLGVTGNAGVGTAASGTNALTVAIGANTYAIQATANANASTNLLQVNNASSGSGATTAINLGNDTVSYAGLIAVNSHENTGGPGIDGLSIQATNGNLDLYAGTGKSVRIQSNSLIVGGATAPIYGAAHTVETSTSNGIWTYCSSSSSSAFISEVSATNINLALFYYGTAGIGGNYTEVGRISTNGSVVTYGGTSDKRLKNNVQPFGDVGAKIDSLSPVTYNWKFIEGNPEGVGFLAQDLYEVVPEAVQVGDSGEVDESGQVEKQWGVDFSKLVPYLVAEVQALRKRVATLEGKL